LRIFGFKGVAAVVGDGILMEHGQRRSVGESFFVRLRHFIVVLAHEIGARHGILFEKALRRDYS
jgi:hypothetical protein